jgi:hypothetical protein
MLAKGSSGELIIITTTTIIIIATGITPFLTAHHAAVKPQTSLAYTAEAAPGVSS